MAELYSMARSTPKQVVQQTASEQWIWFPDCQIGADGQNTDARRHGLIARMIARRGARGRISCGGVYTQDSN